MIELRIPPYACDILKTQMRRNQLAVIWREGIYFIKDNETCRVADRTCRIGALRYPELEHPLFITPAMLSKKGVFLRIEKREGGRPFLVSYTDSNFTDATIENGKYWDLFEHDFNGVKALFPFTLKCEREMQHLLAIAGIYDAPRAL